LTTVNTTNTAIATNPKFNRPASTTTTTTLPNRQQQTQQLQQSQHPPLRRFHHRINIGIAAPSLPQPQPHQRQRHAANNIVYSINIVIGTHAVPPTTSSAPTPQ
jgi:hypothetical protein